jgi:hypothetical protein
MDEKKLNLFVKIFKSQKEINFILYNALYKIKYQNKKYIINQFGIDTTYIYDNITDLFNNYLIYGSSLRESFKDIKIIK